MKKIISILTIALCLVSCGGNASKKANNSVEDLEVSTVEEVSSLTDLESEEVVTSLTDLDVEEDMSNRVNVLTQALPSIMVIPSDQCLKNAGFLTTKEVNGKTLYIRDYAGYILADANNKLIVRAIQNNFIKMDFPLEDLEQSLKSLENQSIMDEADGLAKDAKTLLVANCSPDIIIEFDYSLDRKVVDRATRVSTFSYNMSALDSYTNKAVATTYKSDIESSVAEYTENGFSNDLSNFTVQVKDYFVDLLTNGREITFRVTISESSLIELTQEYNDFAESYADWIRDWVKVNAKKGTATIQRNTAKEMYYTNVRISNTDSDGTQFNAFDFANKFRKEFARTFGIKTENATQGLADAHIIIK